MKILIILATLLFSSIGFSKSCKYSVKEKSIQIQWTAFKTKKKAGVPGTFKKFSYTKNLSGSSFKEILLFSEVHNL